ncbi:putative late blight resistance protein homolog R1B-16 [Lycium ferocissimum]|uniref:putative late blight resistance protein homolog R1B-16 n=1 Tax=Lycium ferocissimum TaxID=112874 RepID=UPI0028154C52|nr:putative late blight resistance protein homolog R1B-16 [Lycium ferocissimum]
MHTALDGWKQVAQDVKSAIFEDPSRQCEKILALSYYYLPQQLKACFLYFGIFPEDDEVNVTRLINLWVAEGLLKEGDDTKSLEDVAEECLQELIDRNLVLVGQQNFCGEVETCKIHDLLHELCLRKARSENFLPVISNESWNRSAPRVSRSFTQHGDVLRIFPTMKGGHNAILEHLHTIPGVGPSWCKEEIFALMPNLKKLEVVLDRNAEEPLDDFWSSDDWDYLWPKNPAHDAFFENLSAFPLNLRRLTLCGLCLNWAAMDIVGMLPNLEALELKDNACGRSSLTMWKPRKGMFSRLKFLSIRNMGFFTKWKAVDDHFPVLEKLFISHCKWLKEIPQEFANIPTVQVIELRECSVHLAKSAKQLQQEQEAIFGCQVTNIHESNCKYG